MGMQYTPPVTILPLPSNKIMVDVRYDQEANNKFDEEIIKIACVRCKGILLSNSSATERFDYRPSRHERHIRFSFNHYTDGLDAVKQFFVKGAEYELILHIFFDEQIQIH